MVNVLLYAIVSDSQLIEKWIDPKKTRLLAGFVQKITNKVSQSKSNTIRSIKIEGYWVYYFHQETFFFMLVADGLERSSRMQNYLRIMTEIFYQNYDQKRFPTVLNRIITQINKIQNSQIPAEQHQGLINGYSMVSQKQRLNTMIQRQQNNSRRAYIISVVLFVCIILLGVYYLNKKT